MSAGDALAGRRVDVEELLDDLAADEMLRDDARHVLELEARIVRLVARNDGQRPLGAEPVAADDRHLDLILQPGGGHLGLERVADLERAGEDAGGAGADGDPAAAVAGWRGCLTPGAGRRACWSQPPRGAPDLRRPLSMRTRATLARLVGAQVAVRLVVDAHDRSLRAGPHAGHRVERELHVVGRRAVGHARAPARAPR